MSDQEIEAAAAHYRATYDTALAELQSRVWGGNLHLGLPLQLILPAGAQGPAFLVTRNYRAILRYNNSMAYALTVGHLADRIAGGSPLAASWPVDDRPLGVILERPEVMPDVIFISDAHMGWLNDFKRRPARDETFKATGFAYSQFEGFEPLGYRLVETRQGDSSWRARPPWMPPQSFPTPTVLVYRKIGHSSS